MDKSERITSELSKLVCSYLDTETVVLCFYWSVFTKNLIFFVNIDV